jgi:protein-disulfide isomerase
MRRVFSLLGLMSSALTIGTVAIGQTMSSTASAGDMVIAEVGGVRMTLAEFQKKRPSALFHAFDVFYQEQRKAIEEYLDDYILEVQAKKEGLTVAQLLERHVDNTIGQVPSEETLRTFYETINSPDPYEKARGEIIKAIRDRRASRAKRAYMTSLKEQMTVKILLAPPRAAVETASTSVRGPANAAVKIVEYGDFECPYCQKVQPVLDKIRAEYPDKVSFSYRDWPLENHPNAQKAAEATQCAAAQGKYWEYHDRLWATRQITVPELKQHARELKLDQSAFDTCLDSGAKAGAVKETLAEGQGLKLDGTPSFFINGRFFTGVLTEENLRKIIEEEVAIVGASAKAGTKANE